MKKSLFNPSDILLPKGGYEKWSVIACDQFTSRVDYWEDVKKIAGDAPSVINLIYPEVYLGKTDAQETVKSINAKMLEYIGSGVFEEYKDSFIYVERIQSDGRLRAGIVGAVDLEKYDYNEGSTSEIRATEKTVLERIPPRVQIRKDASLELPHILMLIDDAEKTVIEPLAELKEDGKMQKLYDFTLMLGGGSIKGYLVPKEYNEKIVAAVEALGNKNGGIALAVGDGNHSLATAKACYALNPNETTRYALTELVNLHSPALEFEPIYRTAENVDAENVYAEFIAFLNKNGAKLSENGKQKITFVAGESEKTVKIDNPPHVLAVGTVQLFLDEYIKTHAEAEIDYIHGEDEVVSIAKKPNACGFIYDCLTKAELFPAVAKEGVLPRKTFSMGHARDKRYYTEARKIK